MWPTLIRYYRRKNGLKQNGLADLVGVDQSTVSRWERGKGQPSAAMINLLKSTVGNGFMSHVQARVIEQVPTMACYMNLSQCHVVAVSPSLAGLLGAKPSDFRSIKGFNHLDQDGLEVVRRIREIVLERKDEVAAIHYYIKVNDKVLEATATKINMDGIDLFRGDYTIVEGAVWGEEFEKDNPRQIITWNDLARD